MDKQYSFNSPSHTMQLSADGSYTAYSKEYDEHYHSTKDGALNESLLKHVIPSLEQKESQKSINILDICFGLGFNTLATIYHHKSSNLTSKINIFSPELDSKLVKSLDDFIYPKEFAEFKKVIGDLVENGVYDDEYFHIEVFLGDAREYIKRFNDKFDIVYQDAFSPSTNPTLWTQEYFADIKNSMKKDAILTTYSTALKTRLALHYNGFNIYINSGEGFRGATIASLSTLQNYKKVDMKHKISCNIGVEPLRD